MNCVPCVNVIEKVFTFVVYRLEHFWDVARIMQSNLVRNAFRVPENVKLSGINNSILLTFLIHLNAILQVTCQDTIDLELPQKYLLQLPLDIS